VFQNRHYIECFIECDSTWVVAGNVNDVVTRGFSCGSADPPYWRAVLEPPDTVIRDDSLLRETERVYSNDTMEIVHRLRSVDRSCVLLLCRA
jgi:hypothetical protein